MGPVRGAGLLKHDGNEVMFMIELLNILFVFMIFTPFVAPAVLCFL